MKFGKVICGVKFSMNRLNHGTIETGYGPRSFDRIPRLRSGQNSRFEAVFPGSWVFCFPSVCALFQSGRLYSLVPGWRG